MSSPLPPDPQQSEPPDPQQSEPPDPQQSEPPDPQQSEPAGPAGPGAPAEPSVPEVLAVPAGTPVSRRALFIAGGVLSIGAGLIGAGVQRRDLTMVLSGRTGGAFSPTSLPTDFASRPAWTMTRFGSDKDAVLTVRDQYMVVGHVDADRAWLGLGLLECVDLSTRASWVLRPSERARDARVDTMDATPAKGDVDVTLLSSQGERMATLGVVLDEGSLYALVAWHTPDPSLLDGSAQLVSCRLEIMRVDLASVSIEQTEVLAEQIDVQLDRTDLVALSLMRDSNLLVINEMTGPSTQVLACTVNATTLEVRYDLARTYVLSQGGCVVRRLGDEVVSWMPDDGQSVTGPPTCVNMRTGNQIPVDQGQEVLGVFDDWMYTCPQGSQDSATVRWTATNLRRGQKVSVEHGFAPSQIRSIQHVDDLVLVTDGDDAQSDELYRLGRPGPVALPAGQSGDGERVFLYGGLPWSHRRSKDTNDRAIVCWSPDSGTEIGRIPATASAHLHGVNAWGYWSPDQFVPATAWAADIDEWKQAVG